MANAVPVLCVARNVACNVRGGFFREFDENLLRTIFELHHEDNVLDIPYPPDVGDYLIPEDTNSVPNNRDALMLEGMGGAEVERLNGPADSSDEREAQQVVISMRPLENEMLNRATVSARNYQSEGGSIPLPPSLFITVLQEIGQLCDSKVEFRSTISSSNNLQFSAEVLFSNEKIGIGIGKTREEAQLQAAEKALHTLASNYVSFVAPLTGKHARKTLPGNRNGFLEDASNNTPLEEISKQELCSNTSKQLDQSNNSDRLSSVLCLIKELCLEGQNVIFRDQTPTSDPAVKGEHYFQVELGGQILGKGVGSSRDHAKLQAAEEAIRTLKTTSNPQIKKHLKP